MLREVIEAGHRIFHQSTLVASWLPWLCPARTTERQEGLNMAARPGRASDRRAQRLADTRISGMSARTKEKMKVYPSNLDVVDSLPPHLDHAASLRTLIYLQAARQFEKDLSMHSAMSRGSSFKNNPPARQF